MIDMTAPHAPYIRAVLADLGEHAQLRGLGYDYEEDTGEGQEYTLMEALIAFVDPADPRARKNEDYDDWTALVWRQTDGWGHGRLDDGTLVRSAEQRLTTALVPTPAAVAAAIRIPARPVRASETPAVPGPLPLALEEAVTAGDLTRQTAARLAAY